METGLDTFRQNGFSLPPPTAAHACRDVGRGQCHGLKADFQLLGEEFPSQWMRMDERERESN